MVYGTTWPLHTWPDFIRVYWVNRGVHSGQPAPLFIVTHYGAIVHWWPSVVVTSWPTFTIDTVPGRSGHTLSVPRWPHIISNKKTHNGEAKDEVNGAGILSPLLGSSKNLDTLDVDVILRD